MNTSVEVKSGVPTRRAIALEACAALGEAEAILAARLADDARLEPGHDLLEGAQTLGPST